METLEDKSNNEILLDIKQLQLEHESLKTSMLKDYDKIEILKGSLKKKFDRMTEVEEIFRQSNEIILKRLKGEA